jgi:ELWxxDGT repeat protein
LTVDSSNLIKAMFWVDERDYGDFDPASHHLSGYGAAGFSHRSSGSGGGASIQRQVCHAGAGREHWVTDGSERGTQRADDLAAGLGGSDPRYLTVFQGSLLYSAATPAVGRPCARRPARATAAAGRASKSSWATSSTRARCFSTTAASGGSWAKRSRQVNCFFGVGGEQGQLGHEIK